MTTLDYRTAGESHGKAILALVEGMPAGVSIDIDSINAQLARRQGGYGRGGRMKIEHDTANILSGVRRGVTIGSPIAIEIANKDYRIDEAPPVHCPRPGHADLSGSLKWLTTDCRETLERASARETATRVAAGALVRCLLREFSIDVLGYVVALRDVVASVNRDATINELRAARDQSEVYCPDVSTTKRMAEAIRQAEAEKDTVGGVVEVQVRGQPPGLGSCMRWQDKLDGRLLLALGSIQTCKGIEIGMGFEATRRPGSEVHDEIDFDPACREDSTLGFVRRSNNAGGIEGGISNGEPIILRAGMKPISTLVRGLNSVDLRTKLSERSDYERSDICAVPAASVVAENVVAFEIARTFLEKFRGDTLHEVRAAYEFYLGAARSLG